jgi:PAS domain S-box-containing protein
VKEAAAPPEPLDASDAGAWPLFELVPDAVLVISEAGCIRYANRQAEVLLGWPTDALRGQTVEGLIPLDRREGHMALRDLFMRAPGPRPMGQGRDLQALRRDGSTVSVEISLQAVRLSDGPGVMATLRDATDRHRVEAALRLAQLDLEQRVAERTALLDIAKSFAATLSLPELLDGILDQLAKLIGYTGAALCGPRDGELVFLSARGGAAMTGLRGMPVPESARALFDLVVQQRRALRLADIWASEGPAAGLTRGAPRLAAALKDVHAWLGVPLLVQDRAVGLLCLDHSRPGYFTEQHAALASAAASHAAIAIENARLYEEAGERAVLEERQRLARELHDSVSQTLYGIGLGARTARRLLDRDPAAAAQPLDYVLGLAGAGLAEMKALLFELRPESLEAEGLSGAIRKQVAALESRHGLTVKLDLSETVEALPTGLKHTLYRVTQEALHNILKHAQARQVSVSLGIAGGRARLRIRDDGVGFATDKDYPGHLGLRSMRERVAQLGGRLEISSSPGKGTDVRAELPV